KKFQEEAGALRNELENRARALETAREQGEEAARRFAALREERDTIEAEREKALGEMAQSRDQRLRQIATLEQQLHELGEQRAAHENERERAIERLSQTLASHEQETKKIEQK